MVFFNQPGAFRFVLVFLVQSEKRLRQKQRMPQTLAAGMNCELTDCPTAPRTGRQGQDR